MVASVVVWIVDCLAATIEPDRGHRLEMCEIYVTSSIAMSPLAFTLSGFERIGEQDFAQSWLV
jgi:hypothetical protein